MLNHTEKLSIINNNIIGKIRRNEMVASGINNSQVNKKNQLPSLIPGEIIFGEPSKTNPKISPDGKKIAYLSPVNNVTNLWIKTLFEEDDRPFTFSDKAIYASYFWSSDKYIVYFQDLSGNENWRLFRLDTETGESKELVPLSNAIVIPLYYNIRDFPDELIITVNKDNPSIPDLYHLNIASEKLTMIYKNQENIAIWLIDNDFKLRGKVLIKDDGIFELIVKDDNIWKKLFQWNIEEQPVTHPLCFSKDNNYIYMIDAVNYNISRVVKIEIKTGKSDVVAFNPEYDIYTVLLREERFKYDDDPLLLNPHTGEIQAVTFNCFRREWIILDETIKEDFDVIKKLDRGDIRIMNRDNSNETWLIGFEKDDGPVSYYTYNRRTKEGKLLFYSNPVLNDYTLSPVEEVIFTSRDGLTIHGYITYPVGKERKNLPLVLYVHGGPWYRDIWRYNPAVQWFANRVAIEKKFSFLCSSIISVI